VPDFYNYPKDHKLHTRYSELVNCIPSKMVDVLKARVDGYPKNEFMEFGIKRHEKMKEYLVEKKKLPKVFGLDHDVDPEMVEHSYEFELFDNVVVHFTPDVHGKTWIADLKTTSRGIAGYKNDKQLVFYAKMLNKLGYKIEKIYYLIELWDKERTELLGYEVLEKNVDEKDVEKVLEWAKTRIERLYEWLNDKENV